MVALQLLVLLVALHTADAELNLWETKLNCTHDDWGLFCPDLDMAYALNEEALDVMQKKLRDANYEIVNLAQLNVTKVDMLQRLLDVLKKEVDALTELKDSCKDDSCGMKKSSWCDNIMNYVSQGICALVGALISIAGESHEETIRKANETFTGLCSEWTGRNRTFFDLTQSLGRTLLSALATKQQN